MIWSTVTSIPGLPGSRKLILKSRTGSFANVLEKGCFVSLGFTTLVDLLLKLMKLLGEGGRHKRKRGNAELRVRDVPECWIQLFLKSTWTSQFCEHKIINLFLKGRREGDWNHTPQY